MKKKTILLFVVFLMLLNGCGYVVTPSVQSEQPSVVPTETPVPTSTPTPLPTETNTPSPTDTPVPTATNTPTPIPIPTEPPVEWDLDPYIEKYIDHTTLGGIHVKAGVIIDRSLEPIIESFEITDEDLANIVIRSLFVVWYGRNHPDTSWLKKDQMRDIDIPVNELHNFEELLAKAQKTGDESDWRKVQINDMSDDYGYIQKPYNFWPMYDGDTPQDVIGIKSFTIAVFRTTSNSVRNMFRLGVSSFGMNMYDGCVTYYGGYNFDPQVCRYKKEDITHCFQNDVITRFTFMASVMVMTTGSFLPPYYSISSYEYVSSLAWRIKVGIREDFIK